MCSWMLAGVWTAMWWPGRCTGCLVRRFLRPSGPQGVAVNKPIQAALPLPVDEAALLAKVEVLFLRSPTVRRKYKEVARALADPVAGRCLRLCARQLLLLGAENTGRRP